MNTRNAEQLLRGYFFFVELSSAARDQRSGGPDRWFLRPNIASDARADSRKGFINQSRVHSTKKYTPAVVAGSWGRYMDEPGSCMIAIDFTLSAVFYPNK